MVQTDLLAVEAKGSCLHMSIKKPREPGWKARGAGHYALTLTTRRATVVLVSRADSSDTIGADVGTTVGTKSAARDLLAELASAGFDVQPFREPVRNIAELTFGFPDGVHKHGFKNVHLPGDLMIDLMLVEVEGTDPILYLLASFEHLRAGFDEAGIGRHLFGRTQSTHCNRVSVCSIYNGPI